MINSADLDAKSCALQHVWMLPGVDVISILNAALLNNDPKVLASALDSVAHMPLERFKARVFELLSHDDQYVRVAASAASGQFKDTSIVPRLLELLSDNRDVYNAALTSLILLRSKDIVPNLIEDREKFLRWNNPSAVDAINRQIAYILGNAGDPGFAKLVLPA